MQLLLIRHAKPQSSGGDDSGSNLSYDGNEQARRLPDALSKFSLARIVSSPQLQALQTAAPVADQFGMNVHVDERFGEYDHGLGNKTAVDQPSHTDRQLTGDVDTERFIERVNAAVDDVIARGEPGQSVAVFTHSGVINAVVHSVMKTAELFSVELDYAGVTRVLVSEDGVLRVGSVNVTDHVWDLLYRTQWWTEEH